MSTTAPIQIPLTQEQFNERVAQLATLGVHLTGTQGTLSQDGITVNYAYDGKVLSVNIVHKPWGIPASFIETKIHAWFKS